MSNLLEAGILVAWKRDIPHVLCIENLSTKMGVNDPLELPAKYFLRINLQVQEGSDQLPETFTDLN